MITERGREYVDDTGHGERGTGNVGKERRGDNRKKSEWMEIEAEERKGEEIIKRIVYE